MYPIQVCTKKQKVLLEIDVFNAGGALKTHLERESDPTMGAALYNAGIDAIESLMLALAVDQVNVADTRFGEAIAAVAETLGQQHDSDDLVFAEMDLQKIMDALYRLHGADALVQALASSVVPLPHEQRRMTAREQALVRMAHEGDTDDDIALLESSQP